MTAVGACDLPAPGDVFVPDWFGKQLLSVTSAPVIGMSPFSFAHRANSMEPYRPL